MYFTHAEPLTEMIAGMHSEYESHLLKHSDISGCDTVHTAQWTNTGANL